MELREEKPPRIRLSGSPKQALKVEKALALLFYLAEITALRGDCEQFEPLAEKGSGGAPDLVTPGVAPRRALCHALGTPPYYAPEEVEAIEGNRLEGRETTTAKIAVGKNLTTRPQGDSR